MGANEKQAATSHGGEFTPELEDIRGDYVFDRSHDGNTDDESRDEFDRLIAKIKAQTLIDLAGQMRDKFTAAWIRGKAREYTHGPHKPVGAFSKPENKEKTP